MSFRYIISTTPSQIETTFGIHVQSVQPENNYNISAGQYTPVITNDKPFEIQLFKFGLTPFWAKYEMKLFNARAEGDCNKCDDPKYHGAMGIIQKKAFRKPIRSQRCLVIASAFILGPTDTGLSKPYLFYLQKHKNPFALAGIWDTWLNPATLERENTFAIITTTANSLIQKIGQKRMPVILSDSQARKWIKSGTELSCITKMLTKYDSSLMNAYPISPIIQDPAKNDKALIRPIGGKLLAEETNEIIRFPRTSGYHQSKRAQKSNEPTSTIAERLEANSTKTIY